MKKLGSVAAMVLFSSSVFATEENSVQTANQQAAKTQANTSEIIVKSDIPGTFYKKTLLDSILSVGIVGSFTIL